MGRTSSKLSSVVLKELEDKTSYHEKVFPMVATMSTSMPFEAIEA
jgi:hypothetical protein